jgi:hypothetical protein
VKEKTDTEECEAMIDMEGELISALKEIYKLRRENQSLKEQ